MLDMTLLCMCRDGDLAKAKLYASELVRDSEDLMKALQNSSSFYAARTFDGVIDLATEIGDYSAAIYMQVKTAHPFCATGSGTRSIFCAS